jgi:quinoprotein glucose dehydrogenase
MRPVVRGAVLAGLLLTFAACGDASRVASRDDLRAEWPLVGGDDGATHYSPLDQITRDNVSHLRPAWTWHTIDREVKLADGRTVGPGAFETTPVMVGDTLFLTTAMSQVIALDAESGREYWRFDPEVRADPEMIEARWGMVHRGVALFHDHSQQIINREYRYQPLSDSGSQQFPLLCILVGADVPRDTS